MHSQLLLFRFAYFSVWIKTAPKPWQKQNRRTRKKGHHGWKSLDLKSDPKQIFRWYIQARNVLQLMHSYTSLITFDIKKPINAIYFRGKLSKQII